MIIRLHGNQTPRELLILSWGGTGKPSLNTVIAEMQTTAEIANVIINVIATIRYPIWNVDSYKQQLFGN